MGGIGARLETDGNSAVQKLLFQALEHAMSLVRLLGFRTLVCGCVIGRYREVATSREVAYVEEKGASCELHGHRRNHTVTADPPLGTITPLAIRAS